MDRLESEFQWFSPYFSVSEHLLGGHVVYLDGLGWLSLCWQLWWIRIAWCFHAWWIRWTGLSQNSNGFLHVALSLSILPCGVFGWLGMFVPALAAYVVYLEGLGCLTLCLNRWQTYKNIGFLRLHMFSTRWEWAALCQNSIVICIFLSLGGCRKPTKTCVFSAFLEAFGSGGFWPGSVLIYNRFFLNPGFSKTLPPSLPPRAGGQNCMVFSACATFVTAFRFPLRFQLVQHLWQAWHLWQLWCIRIAWCFHAWCIRWTGLSQNSNGFLHVSLSLSIYLEVMWCIWMAWDVCPCAGSFGESELHGVSMLGELGGQVWVRIPMGFSMFLCLWAFSHVVYLDGLGCLPLCWQLMWCIWRAWDVCPCA